MIAQHTDNGTEGLGKPTDQNNPPLYPNPSHQNNPPLYPNPSRQTPGLGLKSSQNVEAKYFHCDKKAPYFGLIFSDHYEFEFRWARDFPHPSRPALGPTQPPIQLVPGLSGKESGPPPSRAEVQGSVELYINSPSGPWWPVLG
jgi:hypothetical protein